MAKDDSDAKANEAIGILMTALVSLAMVPVVCVFNAVVIFKYWGWFLLPVFPSAPQPTILQCYGLLLLVSLFRLKVKGRDKTPDEKEVEWGPWKTTGLSVLILSFALLFGWVVHLLIGPNPAWANTLLGM